MSEPISPAVGRGVLHLFCKPTPMFDGEAVVAAATEHHAVLDELTRLQARGHAEVRRVPVTRDGVVVLSERAGSFEELEAWVLPVDPLDVEQSAAQLEAALDGEHVLMVDMAVTSDVVAEERKPLLKHGDPRELGGGPRFLPERDRAFLGQRALALLLHVLAQ